MRLPSLARKVRGKEREGEREISTAKEVSAKVDPRLSADLGRQLKEVHGSK